MRSKAMKKSFIFKGATAPRRESGEACPARTGFQWSVATLKTYKEIFLIVLALVIFPATVFAQSTGVDDPLEVSAAGSLEWDRDAKVFTAKQDAKAVQGDVSIEAQTLKALYRDGAGDKEGMQIHTLKADGGGDDVVITSNSASAYGRTLDYTVDNGRAILKGGNLRMVSADQTVTARDTFEYFVHEGRLIANGNVKVTRPKAANTSGGYGAADTIEADQIIAILGNDAQGKRVLDRLEAYGNVVITTPDEILKGRKGFYDASTNVAEIEGDVVITRGPNILEGAKAQVDLNTNMSKMFGGAPSKSVSDSGTITTSGDGRVRGVFYKKSSKKPDEKTAVPAPVQLNQQPAQDAAPRDSVTVIPMVDMPDPVIEAPVRLYPDRPSDQGRINPLQEPETFFAAPRDESETRQEGAFEDEVNPQAPSVPFGRLTGAE
jgi:lipopolysaccharide export system protein LptA